VILANGDYQREQVFDADVVVIGTGAGGGAVGTELAEAGRSVIFIEEGSHHPTSSFNPYVTESVPRLYRDASATVIRGRPPIPYIEGRCLGGSTVVNGGMAWRAPERVLAEWAERAGTDDLSARALDGVFSRVEGRVSATEQLPLSIGDDNRLMASAARRLGWRYLENRRNQDRCVGANNCVLGCPTGAKQSTLVSYLPHALAAGARVLTELRAERLLIAGGRAVGVEAVSLDRRTRGERRRVTVRARAVIVACGAVQTPLFLLRHGLGRPSRQLGRNFLCHPNAKVLGVYPFDVTAWQGVSQAGQVREFEPEGILLAENMVPPGALASHLPFHGARAWELMRDYNRIVVAGVLVEDSTTGVVRRAPFGLGGPVYNITGHDHARFLKGVTLLARLHFEMGAERVILPYAHEFDARSMDDVARITSAQRSPETLDLFTVHLMGTARMGARPETSVVDLGGQLWDLPGCYVADASLFPTAIGVNPQITIMALATRVAERLRLPSTRRLAPQGIVPTPTAKSA
jgi:choline dehydrogenase-like flavoprotein